jgi:hypothetical protein
MNKTAFAMIAFCGVASAALAQTPADPNAPPKVLQIMREVLKPGHGPAHQKTEAGWPAAFGKAGYKNSYLAVTSTSGPAEGWYLAGWDSYAAYEQDDQEINKNAALSAELGRLSQADGEHLASHTVMFAALRDDLSYRYSVEIPKMRYFDLTTFQVKPGRNAEFIEARKIVQAVHDKQKMDEHWAMYQVTSGAPAGTFLLFLPMKSLAEMDAAQEMHGKAYDDAMGEADRKKVADLLNASLESTFTRIMSFNPGQSYPPKEWAVADAFWAPKTERAAVAAPGKALAKAPAKVADPKQD